MISENRRFVNRAGQKNPPELGIRKTARRRTRKKSAAIAATDIFMVDGTGLKFLFRLFRFSQ